MILAWLVDIWKTWEKNLENSTLDLDYLHGTSFLCLHFGKSITRVLGYVDSNYQKDVDKRISIIGCVFNLHGCTISWKAQLQSTVSLASIKEIVESFSL